MRVREYVQDPFDQARVALGDLLELSSVLYGSSEADRYGRTSRTVHEEVRRPDLREPQEGREGKEGDSRLRTLGLGAQVRGLGKVKRRGFRSRALGLSLHLSLNSSQSTSNCPVPGGMSLILQASQGECLGRVEIAAAMFVMNRQRLIGLRRHVHGAIRTLQYLPPATYSFIEVSRSAHGARQEPQGFDVNL